MGYPRTRLKAIVAAILASMLICGMSLLPDFGRSKAVSLLADDPAALRGTPGKQAWSATVGNSTTHRDEKEEAFDRDCKELATRLRSAAAGDRTQLQQSLRRLIEKHFEYRQSQRTAEIARLNERIQALKLMTARRGENRSEVIDRRFKDLTDNNSDLNWDESRSIQLIESREPVSKPKSEPPLDDERRIARSILLAASQFETGDPGERSLVWTAAWHALHRLPPQATVAALFAALRSDPIDNNRRRFEAWFIAYLTSPTIGKALQPHAEAIISELLRMISNNAQNSDYLLAAASTVWRCSGRPLDDFQGLRTAVRAAVEIGLPDDRFVEYDLLDGMQQAVALTVTRAEPDIAYRVMFFSNDRLPEPWVITMANVLQVAPETPGLALQLSKNTKRNNVLIKMIGMLGPRGEPAVDNLVDLFLDDWTKLDTERRESVAAPRGGPQPPTDVNQPNARTRRLQIIETLGQIGVGERGCALLRELCLTTPSNSLQSNQYLRGQGSRTSFFDGQLRDAAKQALSKYARAANPLILLKDDVLINGQWDLRPVAPNEGLQHVTGLIRNPLMIFLEDGQRVAISNGNLFGRLGFEIDDSKKPKEISISKYRLVPDQANVNQPPDIQQLGIYELTETTLRIQLAKPGDPRPAEFVTEVSKLPEGQTLLDLERKLDE